MEEIWKDVDLFNGLYQVSNIGRVKSFHGKTKILKPKLDKQGYYTIVLCKNKINKQYKIHRLVCGSFLENLENKQQVNNKNGVRNDNRLENLEYMTSSENNIHKFKVLGYKGTIDKTIYTFFNKDLNITEICFKSELIKKYNLNKSNICYLVKGKYKSVKNWIVIKNPESI